MYTCVLNWEYVVGYYSYRKLKDIHRRETTYFELDSFWKHIKEIAKNSDINLYFDASRYPTPRSFIISHPDLYFPKEFSYNRDGFSVISTIRYYDICQRTMDNMKVNAHYLLETAYNTFGED